MKYPYRVLSEIMAVMAKCESNGYEVEWFLFGSFLDENAPSDIDLLAVATEDGCMEFIRSKVEESLVAFPVDLIIMSRDEETELNFISVTRARRVAEILDE